MSNSTTIGAGNIGEETLQAYSTQLENALSLQATSIGEISTKNEQLLQKQKIQLNSN